MISELFALIIDGCKRIGSCLGTFFNSLIFYILFLVITGTAFLFIPVSLITWANISFQIYALLVRIAVTLSAAITLLICVGDSKQNIHSPYVAMTASSIIIIAIWLV